jgi:Ca2+-binding EF-hand superfamily protein
MSASSNATSTSLSRPTTAIIAFTVVAAALGVYYISRLSWADGSRGSEATGLHRSNAVRRSHRAPPAPAPDGEADREQPSIEHLNPQFGRAELSDSSDEEEPGHEHAVRPLGDGETVVDEESIWDVDEQNYGRRVGQNLVQLLFRISEDATKRNSYIHRGTLCNGCGAVPIRGIRYRCANCADFDLCEPCEQHQVHNKSHVFYKIRIPTSYFAPRQMQPAFYPGDPENAAKSLPKEFASRMAQDTGLDRPEIESYWEQWTFMANTEWREDPDGLCLAMDRETFDRCLVPSYGDRYAVPNLIHGRMFSFYDTNKDELISFPEFLHGLAYRKGKDKLKRIFDGYDLDEDGFIERKDFLKMFRAYYVLYKNMRVDMLEFMDEQAMNNTESQQLVSTRAPVSAGFGRDGRFGNPAMPHAGEGKRRTPEGDLELTDQRGVSRPSGTDQRSRNDLFGVVLSGINPIYWQTVSNAPSTLATLQRDVLETIIARREQDQRQRQEQQPQPQPQRSPRFNVFVNPELANELRGDGENRDQQWPPAFVSLSDVEHVCPGATFTTVPRGARAQVVEVAIERLNQTDRRNAANSGANNSVHERWRRRHFYTDEEEGAAAPLGWNPEDDLHWEADTTGANGDEAPRNTRHSRSSSRVRFAEDTDDFETRSNASSRSIPERWGGMDIPDAEKDAGKDILFQVAQQSFNEMLDPLFLFKETQAMTAETSRKIRVQHRHLYQNRYFEQWAREVDLSLANSKTGERNDKGAKDIAKEIREWKETPMMREVELEDVREQPLDRLLAFSGYSVEPEDSSGNANASTNEEPGASSSSTSNLEPSTSSDSVSVSINGNDNPRDQTFPQFRPNSTAEAFTTNALRPIPNETPNTAPPRPPFQPVYIYPPIREDNGNSTVSAFPYRSLPQSEPEAEHEDDTPSHPPSTTNVLQSLRQSILDDLTLTSDPSITPQFVKDLKDWDWMALYKLRELDLVERESKVRHGWGRLSWEEFENVLLGKPGYEYGLGDEEFELGEEGRSGWETFADGEGEGERDVGVVRAKRRERRRGDLERLAEYVGSWVDLCIP